MQSRMGNELPEELPSEVRNRLARQDTEASKRPKLARGSGQDRGQALMAGSGRTGAVAQPGGRVHHDPSRHDAQAKISRQQPKPPARSAGAGAPVRSVRRPSSDSSEEDGRRPKPNLFRGRRGTAR